MRTIIWKILLRLLGREPYHALSENEVNSLLIRLSSEEGLERLPDFLQQCADLYRNQFLYTKDERFRGSVLAFVSLRERILEKRNLDKKKKVQEKLTQEEKNVIMKKRGY